MQYYHYKMVLTWRSVIRPSIFHHSMETWLYAPCPDDSAHMLHSRHTLYLEDAAHICNRLKREIQRLSKGVAVGNASGVFLEIERRWPADYRLAGSERYKVVEDGVALLDDSGKVVWVYTFEDFFKVLKGKLEEIARQLQSACWELATKEVSANA